MSNPRYEAYRLASRKLFRNLNLETPIWGELAREASKLSMLVHNSPISPCNEFCKQFLGSRIRERSYKQGLSGQSLELLDGFWAARSMLQIEKRSPYIDWLLKSTEIEGDCTLVVLKSEWIKPVKESIKEVPRLRHFEIVGASVATEPFPMTNAFVCGAIILYPTALYMAGRSESIYWGLFTWMKQEIPNPNLGLAEDERSYPSLTISTANQYCEEETPVADYEILDSLDPTGIWDELQEYDPNCFRNETDLYDYVLAKELQLEGGARTFVPLNEKIQIAIPTESLIQDSIILDRKDGNLLESDDCIIIRSDGDGDGDVILEYANLELGGQVHILRAAQNEWKDALRNLRKLMTMEDIVLRLRESGSNIADIQNVRNWMSPRNIRTQRIEDFTAILIASGMDSKGNKVWDQMGRIRRAHIRGGKKLKDQLKNELQRHKGSELLTEGRLEVSLSGLHSGSLTAIRIENVLGEVEVRESQLLKIIEPWQR